MRIKCDNCRYTGNCRFEYEEDYPDYLRYVRAETCTRFADANNDTHDIADDLNNKKFPNYSGIS